MPIRIEEVKNKRKVNEFIYFYYHLYKNCPYVAYPLDYDERSTLSRKKNPAHNHCSNKLWLAYEGNRIVGRIAVIINDIEVAQVKNPIGRFGFFDFIDDLEVSKLLMDTGIEWLKSKGIKLIHGPFGFTDLDRQGMLIQGYDRMGTMATIYNYEYYSKHMAALGFEKKIDWVEYTFSIADRQLPEKIGEISALVQQRYGLRSMKVTQRKQLKPLIPEIFELINNEYRDLYGYTMLSKQQIAYYSKNYFSLVVTQFVSIIVDRQNKIIGIGITFPSFTKALQKSKGRLFPFGWYYLLKSLKFNDTLDLYMIAISSEYKDKGVPAIMMEQLFPRAKEFGIKNIETNIELETNLKVQGMWKHFEGELTKRRRCYIKEISS